VTRNSALRRRADAAQMWSREKGLVRPNCDASMRHGLFIAIGGFAAMATTVSLSADHSISGQYDQRAAVTVEGIVLEVLMRNPHSRMRMEVAHAERPTEAWTVEMNDVADMAEQSITSETFRAGDKSVVFGFPGRDGSRLLHLERLHRPSDGLECEDD